MPSMEQMRWTKKGFALSVGNVTLQPLTLGWHLYQVTAGWQLAQWAYTLLTSS